MVGTVIPVVHRERQQNQWPVAILLHTLGYLIGSIIIGSALGLLGSGFYSGFSFQIGGYVIAGILGSISILYCAREIGIAPVPMPQFCRQVPSKWRLTMSPRLRSFLYSLGLGFGLMTRIPVSTFYVPVLGALLIGDPRSSALQFLGFGLGRSLPLLWIGIRVKDAEEPYDIIRVLPEWAKVVHLVNALALICSGAFFIMMFVARA